MVSIAQNCEKIKTHTYAKRPSAKKKQDTASKWAKFAPVGCPVAKSILMILAASITLRGVATISHRALADVAGCSIITVRRKLVQLETAGYLSRHRRHNKRGYRAADSYVLSTHRDDLLSIKPLKRIVKAVISSVSAMMNLVIPQCARPSAPLGIEHLIDTVVKRFPAKIQFPLPGLPFILTPRPTPFCVSSSQGGQR